ncbi:GNAT family N-acetyltransferase [Pedobacter sp. L105]|uniref:GNAT family N-acetyltransferase n=1 Tax=Pedobacter sp. L105 TaxID=1641871 RepID=UPI00131C8C57|nr:GNAT family N-acetyltransferase [Pedobacter sp. L105]
MIYREALISDKKNIQLVRNAVKENRLSNPNQVTDDDCKEYITVRGKGWVCELMNKEIAGFAIVDLKEGNVWALFVRPEDEGLGIGKYLHDLMMDWYFKQTHEKIWLGTGFNTRALGFYRKLGWKEVGQNGLKEVKFEMTIEDWQLKSFH